MKSNYEHPSILLNGREIAIETIMAEKSDSKSVFEQDVLSFCKQWLSDETIFHFKSSGSTGKPKELAIKRSQLLASIKMTAQALQLSKGHKALLCIPVANTGGKMMIARALQLQMKLECVEPSSNPLEKIKNTPDFMAVVPLQLDRMIADEASKKQVETIKKVIVGGARVDDNLLQKLQTVNTPVYATFGMTETVSHIALQLLNTAEKQQYFHVLPEIEVDQDERDCIKIKGPVTDNKWVQTNDRVRLISEDQFEWLGRADLVINSGGYKIQPEVVERKLQKIFKRLGIENNFFIYGLPHSVLGEECALFIQSQPPEPGIINKINEEIKASIPTYEKPRSVRFISKFKTTASGKLDRRGTVGKL